MNNRATSEQRDEGFDLDPARADLLRRLEAGERIPASASPHRLALEEPGRFGVIDDEPTVEIEASR